VRGAPSDFDSWAAGGAEGWAYEDVKGYFIKSEDCRDVADDNVDGAYHGVGGPLTTCIRKPVNPIAAKFVDACEEAGE